LVAHLALLAWPIPRACSCDANQATRPPLREVVLLLQVGDHLASGSGRYHFFDTAGEVLLASCTMA
jgi:hypothetical protein